MTTEKKMKVYYWPFLVRNASIIRMLDHKGMPYEWITDKSAMDAVCSTWGAKGDTFAPPVVVDGDYAISQQVAATMYVAKKCGYDSPDDCKMMQYCLDVIDVSENGWGKNNEHGPTLKKYVEGDRSKKLMNNVERSIKGPFYFGEKPCAADFLLLAHLDWRITGIFGPLKNEYGIDIMKDYPKMMAIHSALSNTEAYKNSKHPMAGFPMKDEILKSYND